MILNEGNDRGTCLADARSPGLGRRVDWTYLYDATLEKILYFRFDKTELVL
jgi:hypothetical protein